MVSYDMVKKGVGLMEYKLWNKGRQFQSDVIEERQLPTFELLVQQHEGEIEL
jgi:hypothetical protein